MLSLWASINELAQLDLNGRNKVKLEKHYFNSVTDFELLADYDILKDQRVH